MAATERPDDTDYDGMSEPVLQTVNGRRKRCAEKNKRRHVAKIQRYSGENCENAIACNHNRRMCAAVKLTATDLAYFKNQLYTTKDKVAQDAILLSHMDIMPVKRRREEEETRQRQRDVTIKYSVLKEDKTRVPVCQASFLSIFCVKKDRVQGIAKHWLETGTARPEKRGGSRPNEEVTTKKEAIRGHIKSFDCRSSHYARRGAPGRKYLPSDLCVAKMHRLFLEQNHLQVTYSLYWSIFMYDFNLAFGHPAKDLCSTCVKSRMEMNDPTLTDQQKQEKIILYALHRRRARQFYNLLNDVGDSFTVCFDMMENLVLPKSAIGQTYYSRQLYYYVFGVVRHHGRGEPQSRHDIHLYTWLESENSKDSNMIASALQHFFTAVAADSLSMRQCLRLFSDSCYGQNKNINVLAMLFALHSQMFPHLTMNYFFPVRGHSFLPADRVFGRIEQHIKKQATILLPDEYTSILHRHGTVHQYGRDWQCYDFKKEAAAFTTQQRSFKISEARVIQICGDRLDCKPSFAGDFTRHSVLRRGKRWRDFAPAPLPDVNCVKLAKKRDVMKLLHELGVPATVQEFYEEALSSAGDRNIEQDLEVE